MSSAGIVESQRHRLVECRGQGFTSQQGSPVMWMGFSPIQHILMLHIMKAAHGRLQQCRV